MGLPLILRQFQSLRCMLSKYHFRSMFLFNNMQCDAFTGRLQDVHRSTQEVYKVALSGQ